MALATPTLSTQQLTEQQRFLRMYALPEDIIKYLPLGTDLGVDCLVLFEGDATCFHGSPYLAYRGTDTDWHQLAQMYQSSRVLRVASASGRHDSPQAAIDMTRAVLAAAHERLGPTVRLGFACEGHYFHAGLVEPDLLEKIQSVGDAGGRMQLLRSEHTGIEMLADYVENEAEADAALFFGTVANQCIPCQKLWEHLASLMDD